MYCKNCGKEINDSAVICPYCGVQVGVIAENKQEVQTNSIAIVGFVLSFIIALAGLICSIIGFNKSKKCNAPHSGLALAGIIISGVNMVIGFILSSLLY